MRILMPTLAGSFILLLFILVGCSSPVVETPDPDVAPTPNITPLNQIPLSTIRNWRYIEIEPEIINRRPVFAAMIPSDADVIEAKIGGDSWKGSIRYGRARLSFGGGLISQRIHGIVGINKSDDAEQHVISNEIMGGRQATMVRPRDGVKGITGVIIEDFRPLGRNFIMEGGAPTREEQAIAFAIFRTIRRLDQVGVVWITLHVSTRPDSQQPTANASSEDANEDVDPSILVYDIASEMYVAERTATSTGTLGIRLEPGEYRLEARDDGDAFEGLPMIITIADGQATYVKVGLMMIADEP